MQKDTYSAARVLDAKTIPSEITVLPRGEFETTKYGPMEFDDAVYSQMIRNFEAGVLPAVPISVDHPTSRGGETRAAGWVTGLKKTSDGLVAEVEWTQYGEDRLTSREYRMVSAEWSFNYYDSETSEEKGALLAGVTLTNYPMFTSLPTLTASSNENDLTTNSGSESIKYVIFKAGNDTMNIQDLLAKEVSELTQEERAFLQDNSEELTTEQKEKLEEVLAPEQAEEETEAEEAVEAEKTEDAEEAEEVDEAEEDQEPTQEEEAEDVEQEPQTKEASDTVTLSASELHELKQAAQELKETKMMQAAKEFSQPFMAGSENGRILPKAKDTVISFVASLTDDQREQFKSIMQATTDTTTFKEAGDSDRSGGSATEKFLKKANELAQEEGIPLSEANKRVKRENEELFEQYQEEQNK